MVHSNILWHIFEYGSNRSQFSRNKNENFKPRLLQFQETVSMSVLVQTFGSLCNSAYLKNTFLTILIAVWNVTILIAVSTRLSLGLW